MIPTRPQQLLTGWRSRAWGLVLFVALLRGLVPHAALATLISDGRPELAYCAPGKLAGATSTALAAHAHCVCAPAADALGGAPAAAGAAALPAAEAAVSFDVTAVLATRSLPARARGPPSRLG